MWAARRVATCVHALAVSDRLSGIVCLLALDLDFHRPNLFPVAAGLCLEGKYDTMFCVFITFFSGSYYPDSLTKLKKFVSYKFFCMHGFK